jgi:hypothetical protein
MKTFGLESRKMTGGSVSRKKALSDTQNSISPSSSMIYQNNFYQSNCNNYRDNQMNLQDLNNSYSTSMVNHSHIGQRKFKNREPKGIRMKITRLNTSAQSNANSKSNSRLVGKRKLLHNIKVKNKNDLQSIMTIKNPQL